MVRAQGQGLAIGGHGLDGPVEVLQNQAEVVMGVGVGRSRAISQAATLAGGLEVAALLVDGPQQQMQSRIRRAQANGGLQALNRLIRFVQVPQGHAEPAMRLETVGLLLQHRDEQLGRLQRLALRGAGAGALQKPLRRAVRQMGLWRRGVTGLRSVGAWSVRAPEPLPGSHAPPETFRSRASFRTRPYASQPARLCRLTNRAASSGMLGEDMAGPSHSMRRPGPTRKATQPSRTTSAR